MFFSSQKVSKDRKSNFRRSSERKCSSDSSEESKRTTSKRFKYCKRKDNPIENIKIREALIFTNISLNSRNYEDFNNIELNTKEFSFGHSNKGWTIESPSKSTIAINHSYSKSRSKSKPRTLNKNDFKNLIKDDSSDEDEKLWNLRRNIYKDFTNKRYHNN